MSPSLHARLAHFARLAGASRETIAAAAAVSPSAVSLWFSGRSKPTYERLALVVTVLGIDLPTFFGPLGDEPAPAQE